MKKLIFSIITLFSGTMAFSQFGTDVIIKNATTIDQRNVNVSAAFNGWLYSAFTTLDSANNEGGITIMKSVDKGTTWQVLDMYTSPNIRYEDVEIEVAGLDTSNLKLFVLGLRHDLGGSYRAFMDVYNATTDNFITGSVFSYDAEVNRIYDLDLATDYRIPALGASPYSVGILLTRYTSLQDSLLFFGSIDGGLSFTVRQTVATTGTYFGKNSLAFGRSTSGSNGRYFAAWEQKNDSASRTGHIYTSRNASTVDGVWTSPICLDSLSSTMINLCRNPRIASSATTGDNDSGSVTSIVLVDRDYLGNASDYDLLGFANERSHFTSFWYRIDVVNTGENDIQPDIVFDTDSNMFRATYFDSTNFKLTYISNDWNLANPSTWTTEVSQYNDVAPGTNPYPRLAYSPLEKGIAAAWTKKGTGTNGVAMFDSDYTAIYIGIDEQNELTLDISTYPNPTTDILNIHLKGISEAKLQVLNEYGSAVQVHQIFGEQQIISLAGLANGIYLLQFEINGKTITQKIIKN